MGHLNTEKPPEKYNARYIKLLVEKIRTAFNFLDESNFPNGISGGVINENTLPLNTLAEGEFHLPFFINATPYTTTDITAQTIGAFVYYNPSVWGNPTIYLDVTAASTASGTDAIIELHSAEGILTTITVSDIEYTWHRQELTTYPTQAQTLLIKVKSSTGTAVSIMGAKLVLIP